MFATRFQSYGDCFSMLRIHFMQNYRLDEDRFEQFFAIKITYGIDLLFCIEQNSDTSAWLLLLFKKTCHVEIHKHNTSCIRHHASIEFSIVDGRTGFFGFMMRLKTYSNPKTAAWINESTTIEISNRFVLFRKKRFCSDKLNQIIHHYRFQRRTMHDFNQTISFQFETEISKFQMSSRLQIRNIHLKSFYIIELVSFFCCCLDALEPQNNSG